MLNFTRKATYQDAQGYAWDYYGDDEQPNTFYVVPRPQFVLDAQNNPAFQIIRYASDDPKASGGGYCHIGVELGVPAEVLAAIKAQIPQRFSDAASPVFASLSYNPGALALFEFQSEGEAVTYQAPASNFGSNTATFVLELTKAQLDTLAAAFTKAGGTYQVSYRLTVPARLPAVTATLSFDSAIAFQYQVTKAQHRTWGRDTPRSVQQTLQESAASKVAITWGVANPAPELQQAVADWANDTLADLVSAEVERALAISGEQSADSFSINSVSSFNATYSQNMVIDWYIQPSALLPSLTDLGRSIDAFTASVDTRQQVMAVAVHLPFAADSGAAPNLPVSEDQPVLLDSVTVTVAYPGLPEQGASYTFTANGSHIFSAPYDAAHGPAYDLSYAATYKSASAPVSGTIKGIDQGQYTLQLEAVGMLSVTFDAAQAFSTTNPPQQVDIAFSYVNSDGSGAFISQLLTIKQSDSPQRGTITSYVAEPIDSAYNYQATYVFPEGPSFTAPLRGAQTGFSQIIPAVNAIHSTELIIAFQANPDDIVIDATVQMWYDQPLQTPQIGGTQPTKAAPAVFSLVPVQGSSWSFVRDTFNGFVNGDQPLVYAASINALAGQINIPATQIANTQPSIMVSPTQRYFTLEVTPAAIDWAGAGFSSVELLVTATVTAKGAATAQPQQRMIWNKGETGSKYLSYAISVGDSVAYAWTATYVTPGQPVQTAEGQSGAVILNIPAAPVAELAL